MEVGEIVSMCESAATDTAYSAVDFGYDYEDYIAEKRKDGCDDDLIKECLTDVIYDDPEFLADMIGDYIYGEANREEMLEDLEAYGSNYREAVAMLRER
jgi:hypothetical protein